MNRAESVLPRIMIAAEGSGCGKTTVVCALLELFLRRKLEVRAFKCGPDYIDPMFHRQVLGVPSYNLDSFFCDENTVRFLLGRHGSPIQGKKGFWEPDFDLKEEQAKNSRESIAILEGVMGYYDGLGGTDKRASAWEIAGITKTPVILLVDCAKRGISSLASLKGFLSFQEDSHIRGVIFNRLSPGLYPEFCRQAKRLGIQPLGYIPKLSDCVLKSRHLGLMMPEEIPEIQNKLDSLAKEAGKGLDLDGILKLALEAPPIAMEIDAGWKDRKEGMIGRKEDRPVIAAARDEAFCFYYADNLRLLESMGARISYFSPLRDQRLPDGADALYLGGGYPELHAEALSDNRSMREEIRSALFQGLPCIAECGGFLYLLDQLEDETGKSWPMAGIIKGSGSKRKSLGRFGYLTMTAKQDGLLCKKGEKLLAHEFHYWDSDAPGTDFHGEKPVSGREWDCAYQTETMYAGFPHLHFYGNRMAAARFFEAAREHAKRRRRSGR